MKKQLSLALVAVLALNILTGCSSKNDSAQSLEDSKSQTQSEELQSEESQNSEIKTADLKLKDGTYHAKGSADEKGWIPTTNVFIENGMIAAITFDDINDSGSFKSQVVANGEYDMTVNGAQASWTDQMAAFADAIVNEEIDVFNLTLDQSGKTDAVSGCTITVSPYVELVKNALEQAKIQS